MPARWIDLLERLELVAALAKRDLGSHDYELFSARAIQSLISKRYKDDGTLLDHPTPQPGRHAYRDVAGD
ncbi:MAG: hypothetical protein KAT00_06170 [Planctomycetes bacterium]|nr:hypothetical protein [Planctomycetota bacterium]